jgi:hypothetical protein
MLVQWFDKYRLQHYNVDGDSTVDERKADSKHPSSNILGGIGKSLPHDLHFITDPIL